MKPIRLQKGVITEKLAESKEFYTRWLGMTVKFEADWFVLLALADAPDFELAFMAPGVEAVRKPYFQAAYAGRGAWLIVESADVRALYATYRAAGAPIDLPLTEEEWGDVHFTMVDPNGIGVDLVQLRG